MKKHSTAAGTGQAHGEQKKKVKVQYDKPPPVADKPSPAPCLPKPKVRRYDPSVDPRRRPPIPKVELRDCAPPAMSAAHLIGGIITVITVIALALYVLNSMD